MPYQANPIMEGFCTIDEGMVRSFLLTGEERSILVDTGACGENLRAFCETLTDRPITVLTTHADGDHTAAHKQFDRVYMHPADIDRYAKSGGDAGALLPMREGDMFTAGAFTLEVVHIPGHTPGSCALLCRERRFLISGDSVSHAPIFMFGEGRSFPAYIASMEKLAKIAPDIDTVYASHGEVALPASLIGRLLIGAREYVAGNLAPQEPPFPLPAKVYRREDAAFLA